MRIFFLMNACKFTNELRERQILRGLGLAAVLTLIMAGHMQQVGKLPPLTFGTQTATVDVNVPVISAIIPTSRVQSSEIIASQGVATLSKPVSQLKMVQLPRQWSLESGSVSGSFNTSAHHAGLTMAEVAQLNHIFADKVDFHHLRKGDHFKVITHRVPALNAKQKAVDEIEAVSIVSANHTYTAIRNADANYYELDGTSLAPGFLRYPVHYTRIGSGFNLHRLDPVTGQYHSHPAIDFDAPLGTPIQATANGRISFAAYEQGYGNVVKINHNGQMMTLYAHMRNFAKGIHAGSQVTKGEVIGYVGMTGYATGPHVHYELHFGNKAANPLTAKLPSAGSVKDRQAFNRVVSQVKPFL